MSESDRKKLEALVNSGLIGAKNSEGAKNTLALLFPKVEKAIETSVPSDIEFTARKRKRRLSLIDFSRSYFVLSPQTDSWGQREFQTAISATPTEAFAKLHKKLESASKEDQSDIRRIFIDLLDAEFSSDRELTVDWITKLVDESPQLIADKDEESKFLFSIDNKDRLRWLIISGLAKLSPDRAASLIRSAIHAANDLTIITDIVRGIIGDSHPDGAKAEQGKVTFGIETENIRDALLIRIRSLAQSGKIWKQARPEELLWFWWGANKEEEVKAFTREAMNSSLGLIGLLTSSINLVRSSSGDFERVSPTWSKIVDLEALRERAVALVRTEDGDQAKQADGFLTALKRGQESSF